MSSRIILAILLSLSQAFAENGTPKNDSPGAKLFSVKCATCHGAKAAGDPKQQTPSLAALPEWYLTRQIGKFQKDIRGANPGDPDGLKMRAVAHTLKPCLLYTSPSPRDRG